MQLKWIVNMLSKVPGVKAVALGGSQSRGQADQHSDYDIGVYYDKDTLDLDGLAKCLKELDDRHRDDLLNPPGQWGPWINGGAWLIFDGTPVDILLRDIKRVEEVLRDCIDGRVTIDYQPGHPFGFVNAIYAAETHYCKPLWQDWDTPLDRLKELLYSKGQYPPLMKEAIIKRFLWEAWFSLECGRKAALNGDVNYAMGSAFRAVCSWVEVIYALNKRYLMNEKGALKWVNDFDIRPSDMEARVKEAYQLFARGDAKKAYQILDRLHSEIELLSGNMRFINKEIR